MCAYYMCISTIQYYVFCRKNRSLEVPVLFLSNISASDNECNKQTQDNVQLPPLQSQSWSTPRRTLSEIHTTLDVSVSVPKYTVYCDEEVVANAKSGKMPNELRHRIIRATIDMRSAASTFNRDHQVLS